MRFDLPTSPRSSTSLPPPNEISRVSSCMHRYPTTPPRFKDIYRSLTQLAAPLQSQPWCAIATITLRQASQTAHLYPHRGQMPYVVCYHEVEALLRTLHNIAQYKGPRNAHNRSPPLERSSHQWLMKTKTPVTIELSVSAKPTSSSDKYGPVQQQVPQGHY